MDESALPPRLGLPPVPRTRLIGRERERADARSLLLDEAAPLLTLTGPGGVGKTRLSLAIAGEAAAHVGDGAVFVDLAALGHPDVVLPAVARALGVTPGGERPLRERLIGSLQRRHLLLVLDNCEHLLLAVADLVSSLLAACPALQVLATSRAPIRIRGEQELPVEPLPLPSASELDLELAANPAVLLFIERAHAVSPRFSATDDILRDIGEICRRLDGLPLAIELAAARVRVLTPAALRERLQRRLPLLEGGARDAPARQQTMRQTIAWSYELLSPADKALFRRLAFFAGGFTLEAAQAVASHDPAADVLPALQRLVEHHLVRCEDRGTTTRYHLLETIREFSLEQVAAAGEEERIRQAHGAYFLALAEAGMPALYGPQQVEWLTRLETEHPNLRVALDWFADQGDADALVRLAAALWRFWFIRGYPREGRAWLGKALASSQPWSPALREALFGGSMLAGNQGDHQQAGACAEHLLALARAHDDQEGIARALFLLSYAATYCGDRDRALALAEQAVAIVRGLGNPHQLTDVLNRLGIEAHNQGDYTRAAALYEEAQTTWRELGCMFELLCVTTNLGVTAQAQGDTKGAAARYREGLTLVQAVGETWMMEELLALVAALASDTSDHERAARLIGATDRLLEAIGCTLAPFVDVFLARARVLVRRELGEEAFTAARETGQRLTRVQALSEAVAVVSALAESPSQATAIAPVAGLTRRELDVLRLVAAGRSNREIADALFISVPTVKRHLTNILGKLDLPSRSAATAFAHTHHLV